MIGMEDGFLDSVHPPVLRNESGNATRGRRTPLIMLKGVREIIRNTNAKEDCNNNHLILPPCPAGTPPPSRRRSISLPPKASKKTQLPSRKDHSLTESLAVVMPKHEPERQLSTDIQWQLLRQGSVPVESDPKLEQLIFRDRTKRNSAEAQNKRKLFAATATNKDIDNNYLYKVQTFNNNKRRVSMPVQCSPASLSNRFKHLELKNQAANGAQSLYPLKANHKLNAEK